VINYCFVVASADITAVVVAVDINFVDNWFGSGVKTVVGCSVAGVAVENTCFS
jgi:hypothetical protein